jgi:zinc/manganese transport system substrate-binding protein
MKLTAAPNRRAARPTARFRLTALFAVVGLLLAACGAAEEPRTDTTAGDATSDEASSDDATEEVAATGDLLVVATTSILGDIVEHLLGDDGAVEVIMPPGSDPHAFQPSAADAAMLREADLVVANGLMLEENLVSALEAAEEDGVRVFEVADQLDPIEFDWDGPDDHAHGDDDGHGHDEDDGHGHDDEGDDHGHDDDGDDHGHAHGPEDPHIWFDPIRMADGVQLIAAELADVDDTHDAEEWERRADEYVSELLAVHEEMEALFDGIAADNRQLITNHDSLGYLAHRYGFEVLGTVVPGSSTQAEADARQFAELIRTVEEAGVTAIFAENTDSTTLAEQLASEVGGRTDLEVEVVSLYTDALGEPGSGAETYLELLRTTAQRISDALR